MVKNYSREIKDSFLFIELLDKESLDKINEITKIFGTHYTRENVKNIVRVMRKEKGFKFFDRLMRKGSRSRI